jgi:hypothetical protein
MKQSEKETFSKNECVYCTRLKKCIQHHKIFHHRCNNYIQVVSSKSNSKELYDAILFLISITASYWFYLNDCDFYSSLSLPILITYLMNKLDKTKKFSDSAIFHIILKGSRYLVGNSNLVITFSFFIFLIPHLNEHFLVDVISLLCIYFIIKYTKEYFILFK